MPRLGRSTNFLGDHPAARRRPRHRLRAAARLWHCRLTIVTGIPRTGDRGLDTGVGSPPRRTVAQLDCDRRAHRHRHALQQLRPAHRQPRRSPRRHLRTHQPPQINDRVQCDNNDAGTTEITTAIVHAIEESGYTTRPDQRIGNRLSRSRAAGTAGSLGTTGLAG
jgi:hypothetical protein